MKKYILFILTFLFMNCYFAQTKIVLKVETQFNGYPQKTLVNSSMKRFMDTLLMDVMNGNLPAYYAYDQLYLTYLPEEKRYASEYQKKEYLIEKPTAYFHKSFPMIGNPLDSINKLSFLYKTRVFYELTYKGRYKQDLLFGAPALKDYFFQGRLIDKKVIICLCFTENYSIYHTQTRDIDTHYFCYVKLEDIQKKGYKICLEDNKIMLVSDFLLNTDKCFETILPVSYKFIKGKTPKGINTHDTFYVTDQTITLNSIVWSFNVEMFKYYLQNMDFITLLGNFFKFKPKP